MRVAPRLLVATLLAAVVMTLGIAGPAAAAPAAFEQVDITVHTEQGTNVLLVAGKLPEGTPLPAKVDLAVPPGQVQWAGEILGGSPDQDPEVEYTVRKGDGVDIYSFTLTKSLVGQVEVVNPSVVAYEGTAYNVDLSWTPASDVGSLAMSVRMPQGSQVASAAPGAAVTPGQQGFSYYRRQVNDVKAGESQALRFSYVPGAVAAAGGASTQSGSGGYLPVVIGFGAVLGIAFLLFLNGRKRPVVAEDGRGSGDSEAFDTDGEPEPQAEPAAKRKPAAAKASAAKSAEAIPAAKKAEQPSSARPNQKLVILAAVAAVVGVFALVSMMTSRGATQSGDTITMQIAQVDTCTTANIQLATPAGKDLSEDAESILEKLRFVSGVGDGTITLSTSTLVVNYCESNTTEDLIRQAIAPTGYLASATSPGSTTPATATPAAGQ